MNIRLPAALSLLVGAALLATTAQAQNTLSINYYTISATDPDANHLAFSVSNNEVQNLLGPDGLPVLNTAQFGCTSNCFPSAGAPTNVTAGGEITYWSPKLNPYVTETLTSTVSLPYSVPANFFPPNGAGPCDGPSPCNGYQAAELYGNLVVPTNTTETVSFNIGADDMAFAYLDGQVVCDLGGVHGSTAGTCVTPFQIGAGSHSLEVYFVDINQSQSGLTFNVDTGNVTTTGSGPAGLPEPESLLLLGTALAGIAWSRARSAR